MSVTDPDDDEPTGWPHDYQIDLVNGELMDQMHQAAQDLPDPPPDT